MKSGPGVLGVCGSKPTARSMEALSGLLPDAATRERHTSIVSVGGQNGLFQSGRQGRNTSKTKDFSQQHVPIWCTHRTFGLCFEGSGAARL
jgi:hypothetical protein